MILMALPWLLVAHLMFFKAPIVKILSQLMSSHRGMTKHELIRRRKILKVFGQMKQNLLMYMILNMQKNIAFSNIHQNGLYLFINYKKCIMG